MLHHIAKLRRWGAFVATLTLVAGCERGGPSAVQPAQTDERPTVYTTFHPTTYFAERIGGEFVDVVNPCPPDADPATWMPDDATIAKYQQADLIVINGAEFEEWLAKATLPPRKVVDTAKPLADDLLTLDVTVTHSHGPGGAHSHEGLDGHTWLEPGNATIQATEIKRAFERLLPAQSDAIDKNYAALVADLAKLDDAFKQVATLLDGRLLLCNHPAYNYVARAYGWKLKTFLLEPDAPPTDAQLAEIKAYLAEHDARLMLWEDQPDAEVVARLATAGALTHVVFAPAEALDAAALDAGENYLTVMQANLARLRDALKP